ncbi:ATPase domain-containing protein [Sphingomonas radiodurans]|uniref:ATPase domain-containing protein n=1 Tax=Sphingomonas radiodurans TaxID=2890321 RepID=UPI001E512348|nr:ATPase domain-containing protein [Sphingomonas radiodurans]WBH16317.1 AAA family ATPase [Sphingomonas radiodurans]
MNTDRAEQERDRVLIRRLPTGVPGLDEIFAGGLPEYSFNIIAGNPGGGKTTLAHQIMFANATEERPALYFTVLGEPAIKMLRYQQQFSFFDMAKVNGAIRFINLSHVVMAKDLGAVLDAIVKEVEESNAGMVFVDSFRTMLRGGQTDASGMGLPDFIQRLALYLTSWQVTSFLIGEYSEAEFRDNPVFTVADGLLWLNQSVERNSIVRKMQVIKMRGQNTVPGMHTFRITDDGVQTFPRTFGLTVESSNVKGERRLSTGVPGFDALLNGGIPEGDSMLLAGPSGSGKSVLASQFAAEGLRQGEPAVIVIFEELPKDYIRRAGKLGIDFVAPQDAGTLKIIYIRPLDLSVDETVHEVIAAVKEIGAKRVVIDSLVGFEMALAPDFRHEFRESLYRMIGALTRTGATVVSTVEVEETSTSMGLSNYAISFLTDDIVRLRYVSIDGQLRKMIIVVKMRGGPHSIDMHEYTITDRGVVIGEPLRGYRGLISGIPEPLPWTANEQQDQDLASRAPDDPDEPHLPGKAK